MRRLVLLVIPVLLLLASCDSKRFYEQYNPIAEEAWSTGEKQVFEVAVDDTTSLYSLFFNIRHTGEYRFRNLVFLAVFSRASCAPEPGYVRTYLYPPAR